jgi:hypothetical protein
VIPDAPPDRPVTGQDILAALARLIDAREDEAHDALQVGGYVPLDRDVPVEIPLALCYAAREILEPRCAACRGFGRARRPDGALTETTCRSCAGRGRLRAESSTASAPVRPNRPLPRIAEPPL